MARPFPLYHWSPTSRRKQIRKLGLVPGKRSRCGQWKPPYICFSDSPSYAWGATAMFAEKTKEWDLWMTWSNVPDGYEKLTKSRTRSKREYPTEFRVYERIRARDVWYVGTRRNGRGRKSMSLEPE